MDNQVYWRPYITNNGIESICMQWFDECDYNKNRYYNDKKYNTKEKCENKCNKIMRKISKTNVNIGILIEAEYTKNGIKNFLKEYSFWKKIMNNKYDIKDLSARSKHFNNECNK